MSHDTTTTRSRPTLEPLDFDVVSICGPVREENQDAAAVWRDEEGRVVAIVADGMGGHRHGREAAEIVVRSCLDTFREEEGAEPEELLRRACLQAHGAVQEEADRLGGERMGATAVIALLEARQRSVRLRVTHVGDSRAYLFRGRSIYRLTRDHSPVGDLVRDGLLKEEDAFGHPDSNIVHRAFGQTGPLDLEIQPPLTVEGGDRLVLCSDGLHGALPDRELLAVVTASDSSREICRNLSAAAVEADGHDNISVVCVKLPARPERKPTKVEG